MNVSHQIKFLVFLNGVTMQCNGGNGNSNGNGNGWNGGLFNFTVTNKFINSNMYSITFATSNATTITAVRYSRFIFDQTLLQTTKTTYVDADVLVASNSAWG